MDQPIDLSEAPTAPVATSTMPSPRPTSTQGRVPKVALGVLALLVVGGAGYLMLPSRAPKEAQVSSPTPATDPVTALNDAYNRNDFNYVLAATQGLKADEATRLGALLFEAATLAQRAMLEYKPGYATQAIALAQEALTIDSQSSEAYRVIGFAHEASQRYSEALAQYEKALTLAPESAVIVNNRGHVQDLMGNLEAARADYQRALTIDPGHMPARLNMARVYMRDRKFTEAATEFTAVTQNSDNARLLAEAYFNLSTLALYNDENPEASLTYATQSVTADPSFPFGYVGQARIYTAREMWDEAKIALEKSLTLYPNLAAAHEWIGLGYAKLGQLDDAAVVFTSGKETAGVDVHLMANEREAQQARFEYYLAAVAATAGNAPQAITHIKTMLTLETDVVTFAMLETTMQQSKNGFFAPLVGNAEYDALVANLRPRTVAATPAKPLLARLLKIPTAEANHAIIVNYHPHGTKLAGALYFDNFLYNLLVQYVHGQISYEEMQSQCSALAGRATCVIKGDLATGMTIGCANATVARYYPPNQLPIAVIQASQVFLGETVTVDGSASRDPDGQIVSYAWTISGPDGVAVPVGGSAHEQFVASLEGNYIVQLTVHDNVGALASTSTSIAAYNTLPVAVISAEASTARLEATLNGSASYDPDQPKDHIVSYAWTVKNPSGAPVAVTNSASALATFTPQAEGQYEVVLEVVDTKGAKGRATQAVTVGAPLFNPGDVQETE